MRFDALRHATAWMSPRLSLADPWVRYVPFAMTLVELTAPRSVVEVGSSTGLSYCAFCQAVEALKLDTRAVSVPDGASGGTTPAIEHFRAHHDSYYAAFSAVSRHGEARVCLDTPIGDVDLLSLQTCRDNAVEVFDRWQGRLSAQAVVLVDGIDQTGSSAERLWLRLRDTHPSFVVGDRLGLVAVGREIPEGLRPLLALSGVEGRAVASYFDGLGRLAESEAHRLQKASSHKDDMVAERDAAVAWLRSELATVRKAQRTAEQRNDWYAVQLESIFRSRAWQVLSRYRRVREKLGLSSRSATSVPERPEPLTASHAPEIPVGAAADGVAAPPVPIGPDDALTACVLLPRPNAVDLEAALDAPAVSAPRRRLDIVYLSIIDWEFRFQRPQQLATQFAAHGHRLFFVSPSRFRRAGEPPGVRELADNIFEVELASSRPPDVYGEAFDGAVGESLLASIDELRRTYNIAGAVVMTAISSWTPVAFGARERWQWPVAYDCMDEWENFQGIRPVIVELEQQLVRACDLIVVTAARLRDKWLPIGRPLVLARNAADVEFYTARYRPNTLVSGVRHPIVGYYGAIADWFDLDLMEQIAKARPAYHFILIGGVFDVDVSRLKALSNVSLLGQQPYATMPQYLYHFDACIIPFKVNAITEATDPVKLYEYLSAGKPVVSVDLPELEPARDQIYLARTAPEFVAQLDVALGEDDRALEASRKAFVARNTWKARYEAVWEGMRPTWRRASIVIVTYNNVTLNRLCLESLLRNTLHPNFEIIVVDNASTDSTPAYLKYMAATHPEIRVILNRSNHGFARANNQGLAVATGDDLVLLNNDTIVPPGWLIRFVRYLTNPAVGLVGPVTNFVGNEAKVEPTYQTWAQMEEFAAERARLYEGQVADISMLAMFAVAMRRDTFERLGPLDEQFGVGMFEDDDYSRRVQEAGLRVVCAGDVFVHHFGQAAFKVLIERGEYNALFEENKRRYEAKWQRPWLKHEHRPLPFSATPARRTHASDAG